MVERTVPHRAESVPVRSLRVEVVEGPDEGAVVTAPSDVLTIGSARDNDLVLEDRTVSRYHAELGATEDGVRVSDLESTNGTWAAGLRLARATVPEGTVLTIGRTKVRVGEAGQAEVPLHEGDTLGSLRGRSLPMRRLMARIAKVAESDVAVLLRGESGTGKELAAEALHELGPRSQGPFVTVDCGAIAPTLVASELFGHERGAFTGADRQHAGAFERADGGTVFLDEVGELPAQLQATLLGVLERRRFRRLGGKKDISVDVRLVAATHRDLRADVNEGRFRLDLYYRLAVVKLQLPPLRERRGDIPLLVQHFLDAAGHRGLLEDVFPPAAMEAMNRHRWPGNVRELRNFIEATLAMGEVPELEPLAPGDESDPIARLLDLPWKKARGTLLGELERRYLEHLLERADGNVSKASRMAEMDRSYLTDLLRRHGMR